MNDPASPSGPAGQNLAPLPPEEEEASREVLEPEIVGLKPARPPWWRQLLSRMLLAGFVAVMGVVVCAVGFVFTLTLIGAAIGIPLIFLGVILLLLAGFLLLGTGRIQVVSLRNRRY